MDNKSNNNNTILADDDFKVERGLKVTKLKNIDGYNIDTDGKIIIMTEAELKSINAKLEGFVTSMYANVKQCKDYKEKLAKLQKDSDTYCVDLLALSRENQRLEFERLTISNEVYKLRKDYEDAKERIGMLQLKNNLLEQNGAVVSYSTSKVTHEILEIILNYKNMGYSYRKIEERLKEVGLSISRETIRNCVNDYNSSHKPNQQ